MQGKWLTPVVTAFDNKGNIDYQANGNIYDFLIEGGVDGIVILGSTGEFFSMSIEQKKSLINFAVNYINKRTKVIIGSSCMRVDDTIDLSNFAYDVGADAVMIISPYYFSLSRESIELYYDKVANGCKLPIYLYNFPDRTGYDLTPDIILSLSQKHKNIIGCKDTVSQMGHTREIIEIMRKENPEFEVYSGYDENFAHNILSGGAGCIGGISNFAPEICSEAIIAVNSGDFNKVEHIQKMINKIMKIYDIGKPFIPIVKRAMMLRKIEMQDYCTEPFIRSNDEQEEEIRSLLKEFNLI